MMKDFVGLQHPKKKHMESRFPSSELRKLRLLLCFGNNIRKHAFLQPSFQKRRVLLQFEDISNIGFLALFDINIGCYYALKTSFGEEHL
jgi:hypothetical protein